MKWDKRRIITAIIAILIALIMLLSVLAPLFASAAELPEESAAEAALVEPSEAQEGAAQEITILNNVTIGGINVSRLDRELALRAVKEATETAFSSVLAVHVGEEERATSIAALGAECSAERAVDAALMLGRCGNMLDRYKEKKKVEAEGYDVPLSVGFDAAAVRSFLAETAAQVNVPVVNRSIMLDENGEPYVTEGSDGMVLDTNAGFETLLVELSNHWSEGDLSVELETHVVPRGGDAEQLARVRDVLGSGTTNFAGSTKERCGNIENLVRLINGSVIMPGEQFSMLSKALPFSAENGYQLAFSMYDGSLVDTYGGGICQVSTTLYLALLKAELQIDQRSEHSMIVGYTQPSMDAAISEEGGKDLVFTNQTDAPIVLSGYVDGEDIYFSVYGAEYRPGNRNIKYRSEVTDQVESDLQIGFDEEMDAGILAMTGAPHMGMEAQLWKDITTDGETTSEWVNSSTYAMSPAIYTVGLKGFDEEWRARIIEAAESEDLGELRALISESPCKLREYDFNQWDAYLKKQAKKEAQEETEE